MKLAPKGCAAALFLFLLLTGTEAVAQELKEYLREIRTQNPAYQAAYHRWQAAEAEIDSAASLPDPNLNLGFFVEEVETRVGPQKQRVGVSQSLPWRGKRALRGRRAEEMAHKSRADLAAVALRLETEFKILFAEYYFLGRSIQITREHLTLLQDLEAVVTERYETSTANYHDLIRIQIEIDALSDRLKTQEESGPPLASSMNAVLGRSVAREISFPGALPASPLPDKLKLNGEPSAFTRENPLLRSLDHQIAAERVGLTLAKKKSYPDFRVGLNWINTGNALNPNLAGSGTDPLLFSVGVNLPIWGKKNRALRRGAASRVEAAVKQRDDAYTHLQAGLKRQVFQWDNANRKITLYRDQIIPKAEESLVVITSGFQTGDNSFLDLIQAEKALLEFSLTLNQAEANQLKAVAAIETILGRSSAERE